MANNRELSQLASLIFVDDTTRNIGIATTGFSKVGIGTTNPGAKLTVVGGTTAAGGELNLMIRSSNPNIPATITGNLSSSTLQIFAGGMSSTSERGGQIDFVAGAATTDPGTLIFRTGTGTGGTSQPERVRIDSSGNVGIGTTNPTAKLQVIASESGAFGISTAPNNATSSVSIQNTLGDAVLNLVNNNQVSAGLGTLANNGSVINLSGKWISATPSANATFGAIGAYKENNTSNNRQGYLSLYTRPSSGELAERVRITSSGSVGIGTTNPTALLDVFDANQNSDTYSSEVYRTSTNFSSGVGHRAYYESYYTTAGVQTSYASGINAQVSASVAAGSTNNGYIRGGLDGVWRNNANAQSSTDNGTLNILYGRGISYGHFDDNAVSPITNTAIGLAISPYCYTGRIGTLIGLDINSVATAVGATATNVYGINCDIDTTDGTNPYNLYIGGNAKNYIAGDVGIGTTNPQYKTHIVDTAATGAGLLVQGGGGGSPIARFERIVGASGLLVDVNASGSDPQIVFNRVGFTTFAIGLNQSTGSGDVFEIASSGVLGTNTRFVIDSSNGNVGIGTTNPTSKLHVIGDVLVTGITTSTDFNSSSDINLKDNIEKIQNPIDKLQQLDGVTFNWKESHRASVGVIAQQVEKVLPQLVSGDETKTVNYNGLIALLIECVKEQQIEINNLKEKLK